MYNLHFLGIQLGSQLMLFYIFILYSVRMIQCFHVSLWFALVLILTILSDTDILCNIDCDHNKWLRKLGFELPPHTYNVDCDKEKFETFLHWSFLLTRTM